MQQSPKYLPHTVNTTARCITNHTSGCTGVIQLHSLMYRASSWHVHNMSGSHRLCNPRKQYSTKEQNTSTAIPHNSLKNEPCMGTYRTEIANIYLGYPRETSRAEEPLQGSSRSFLREPWVEIALDAIVLIEQDCLENLNNWIFCIAWIRQQKKLITCV